MFRKMIRFLVRYRWPCIVLLAALLAAGAWQTATSLRVDNSVSIWFLEDNPDYQAYLDFQQTNGSDEVIIAMLPTADPLSKPHVEQLRQLHGAIDTLPYVTATLSLANAQYPIYSGGQLYLRSIVQLARPRANTEQLLADLPALRRQLIAPDGQHTFFFVQLDPTDQIEDRRNQIVEQVKTTVQALAPEAILSGQPILNEAFNESIYRESSSFAVYTLLVIILLLYFLLPHWSYLPIALASVAVPVAVLMGLMTGLGYSLNLVSMLIPTILLVYSVGDAVHVLNIFHQHCLENPDQDRLTQIQHALRHSLTPCFYTTLTTVVGYLALCVSPLPAFKIMGAFTFLGLGLAFLLVYAVTAIGLSFSSYTPVAPRHSRRFELGALTQRIGHLTTHRSGGILGLALVIFFGGLFSLSYLKPNTDSLDLLPDGGAKADLHQVEAALGGNARLQLQVTRTDSTLTLNAEQLRKLTQFQDSLIQNPHLAAPFSVVDFRDFLRQRLPPLTRLQPERLSSVALEEEGPAGTFFTALVNDDGGFTVAALVKELETQQLEILLADVQRYTREVFGQGYQVEVYGFLALFAQLNRFVLQTQLWSFGIAFGIAFGILFFFVGDFRTSLLALLPNLLPLAMAAIVMATFGISLNTTNAMLAPIMLGVAMDDTIHLMNQYRRYRAMGRSVQQSMDDALNYTGRALLSTTIALVCGFLVVGLSGVASVSMFGLLCAFTIVAALLADVVVLPTLIKRFC